MIIAKRILCGVLSMSLIFVLCSCKKSDDGYPFESLPENKTGEVSAYRIVVPADCSAALYEKAESLAALLGEQIGGSASVIFDYEAASGEEIPELLLGYTCRPLSIEYLGLLRKDDYLCCSDGKGGAVIGGKTDEATIAAVARFCSEILPAASAECLMREEAGFFYEATYSCDRVLLNGFELNRYCLVYPEGIDGKIRALTELFRDRITEYSGYVLDIFPDAEIQGMEKQIRLREDTDDERSGLAYIESTRGGIEISSRGLFGFSVGLSELESLLFSSETKREFRCEIDGVYSVPYERDEYRIGSIQIKNEYLTSYPDALTELLLPVRDRLPDGVVLNAMDENSQERIADSLYDIGYKELISERGEKFSTFAKNGAITAMSCELVRDGGPTVTVCRVGSEAYGFYLVRVSGVVNTDDLLELPLSVRESGLPVVVLVHTEQRGGVLSLAEEDFCGMRALCNESYSVEGESYLFQCYVTDGPLEITVRAGQDGSPYREITVRQSSVYS